MPQNTQIQVRRSVSGPNTVNGSWAKVNPTLAQGEIGFETDTGKFKIGDGSTAWNSLSYATDGSKLTGTIAASTVTNGVYTNTANTLTTGTLIIQAGADDRVPLRLKRNSASQTADILQVNTSDDATTLAKIDSAGKITATDFVDLNMTTTGVVTNTSGGLFQSSAALSTSLGGTGSSTVAGARANLGIGQNFPPFAPGGYYRSANPTSTAGTNASAVNTIYVLPFYVGADTTFSNVGVRFTSVGAGGTMRIAIYRDSSGSPGSLVYGSDPITVSTGTTTDVSPDTFPDLLLTAGWYWMGAVLNLPLYTSASLYCYTSTNTTTATNYTQRTLGPGNSTSNVNFYYIQSISSGTALPSAGANWIGASGFSTPVVWIRVKP
jgi:hypothetical protein